jgi:hypothetical protein
MIIEEALLGDDLFEIEVSDLRALAWVRRTEPAPYPHLSTRQRARRYVASLLALALLLLGVAPGVPANLPVARSVARASAWNAARPGQPVVVAGVVPRTSVDAPDAAVRREIAVMR